MEWLQDLLKDLENGEELQKKVMEGMGKHFVPRSEFNLLNNTRKTLEEKVVALEKATNEAQQYKSDFLQLQEKVRLEEEAQEIRGRFHALSQGNEWRDELTETAIYAKFREALGQDENKERQDTEIFQELVGDGDYFKNPNPPIDMPPMGNMGMGSMTDNQMRAVMGLPYTN